MDAIEGLSNYDRVTLGLWRRACDALDPPAAQICLTWAAVHAVLAGLRRHRDGAVLMAAYDSSSDSHADFALIGSLLPDAPSNPMYFEVREAAFYLRWRELGGLP
ncbi:MAG TPA: hypothetical protein VG370_19885 [Chloroflexota bacterium]|nr:hypothetical protein [Chloroflexota bacterium]